MAIVKSTSKVGDEEVEIYIEVDGEPTPDDDDEEMLFRDYHNPAQKAVQAVGNLFGQGLALTRNCAAEIIDSVQQMEDGIKPNEFQVQLAIKLDSEVGAVIAKAVAGAQLVVTMKWTLKENSKSSEESRPTEQGSERNS